MWFNRQSCSIIFLYCHFISDWLILHLNNLVPILENFHFHFITFESLIWFLALKKDRAFGSTSFRGFGPLQVHCLDIHHPWMASQNTDRPNTLTLIYISITAWLHIKWYKCDSRFRLRCFTFIPMLDLCPGFPLTHLSTVTFWRLYHLTVESFTYYYLQQTTRILLRTTGLALSDAKYVALGHKWGWN